MCVEVKDGVEELGLQLFAEVDTESGAAIGKHLVLKLVHSHLIFL